MNVDSTGEDPARENMMEWLSTQGALLDSYQGEWVAFSGHDIVAHAPSFLDVMREVEARGIDDPFLVPVVTDEPFIG